MITAKHIIEKIVELSRLNIFKKTRKREYVEARSLLNHILYNHKRMTLFNIVKIYKKYDWEVNHATILYSLRTYGVHKNYNKDLIVWEQKIIDKINQMDNYTKREYIKSKVNYLNNKDVDELTMVISNMVDKKLEYAE
jgi:hypothetical protein